MYESAISQIAAQNAAYPPKEAPASPFVRVRDACDAVASIEKRVTDLSNRFAGSFPEGVSATSGPHPVPNGMFEELDEAMAATLARCERMHMALNRIENRLP